MKQDSASVPASHAISSSPMMTAYEFARISHFLKQGYGIDLKPGKENLVSARLGKKVRAGNFRSFRLYFEHVLKDPSGAGLIEMVDALTTNHTAFFREMPHFEFLRQIVRTVFPRDRRLRIWSAASSTGEEPYSIACTLHALGSGVPDFEVVASDLSTRALERAREAVYPAQSLAGVEPEIVSLCFQHGKGVPEGQLRLRDEVARRVQFCRVNLVEPLPSWPSFQIIFCRNVMIYFDAATQSRVVAAISARLLPGGFLFVGHSESLAGLEHGLEYVRPAVYRKLREGKRP